MMGAGVLPLYLYTRSAPAGKSNKQLNLREYCRIFLRFLFGLSLILHKIYFDFKKNLPDFRNNYKNNRKKKKYFGIIDMTLVQSEVIYRFQFFNYFPRKNSGGLKLISFVLF